MTRSKRRPVYPKVSRIKRTAAVRRLHRVLFLSALSGATLLPRVAAQSIEVSGAVNPGTPDSPSSWIIPGSLAVGQNAIGSMTVSGGAIVSSNSGLVGDLINLSPVSGGSVTIDGAGSAWNIAQQFNVGQWTSGTLTVSNGGTVTARTGAAGSGNGANGTITVTGAGSSLILSGGTPSQLILGQAGVGTLNVLDGGFTSSAYVSAGQSISGTGSGTILVSGVGSELAATTLLTVGDGSDGSLTIEAGGAVVSASAYVGGVPSDSPTAGAGTVVIGGAGSTWTVANQLYIGFSRGASVRIENQASVTSNESIIGLLSADAPATVEVTSGGAWTSTTYIGVGLNSQGSLEVNGGGVVTTPTVQLGSNAAGSGEVILSGNAEDGIGTIETTVIEKGAGSGSIVFDGGRLRATGGDVTNLISNVTVQLAAGGAHIDTNGFNKLMNTEMTGVGGLIKEGEGALLMTVDQTYLGTTVVEAGLLLAAGLSSSEVIVQAGAVFNASEIAGDLSVEIGGQIAFEGTNPINVLGSVSMDSSFGVDDLFSFDILSLSLRDGSYDVITSASTDFSTLGLENWGLENALTLSDGRIAYFEGTNLEVVIVSVIPEPASVAYLLGLGALGAAMTRRRCGKS